MHSRTNSKAYSRRLPTHYSPSITHYSPPLDTLNSPEITPPPPISLEPNNNNNEQRRRSQSESQSVSNANNEDEEDDDAESKKPETIEINNGRSVLFSSWFSWDNNHKEKENEDQNVIAERKSNSSFTTNLKPPKGIESLSTSTSSHSQYVHPLHVYAVTMLYRYTVYAEIKRKVRNGFLFAISWPKRTERRCREKW